MAEYSNTNCADHLRSGGTVEPRQVGIAGGFPLPCLLLLDLPRKPPLSLPSSTRKYYLDYVVYFESPRI